MGHFAEITIGQILSGSAGVFILLSILVEISPIKISPLKWLGRKINGELINKVDTLEKEMDKRNAVNCRMRILSFGDELRRGVQHSKEHFDQILELIDGYEKYCNNNPEFKNNKTVATTTMILEVYAECVKENKFL